MTTHDHQSFDRWLDDFVAGRSTPAPNGSDARSGTLDEAARQFHGLARRAEAKRSVSTDIPRWETIMSTHQSLVAVAPPRSAALSRRIRPSGSWPNWSSIGHSSRWRAIPIAFNVALAVVVAAAISIGMWRMASSPGDDGGDRTGYGEQPQQGLPALTGSPESFDPASFPSAEDCTVIPLTVDQVIGIMKEPYPYDGMQPQVPGTPDATPVIGDNPGLSLPSPDVMAGVDEAFRQWYACQLKGNWFQIWATESPAKVQAELRIVFPGLPTEEEIRTSLTALEADPTQGPGQLTDPALAASYKQFSFVLDPDLEHSVVMNDTYVIAGYFVCKPLGDDCYPRPAQESYEYQRLNGPSIPGSTTFVFVRSEDDTYWLVASEPSYG